MIIKPGTIIHDKDSINYEIIDSIGNGGFATVFKIKKQSDGSLWALKTLFETYHDEKLLKGLINEGNLAVKITHPNVIKYIFFHDGSLFNELPPYIIMEFANQGTLRKIIEKQLIKKEFLQNVELGQYCNELINGMEAINAELVHRDIKPENILVKDNVIKISDFGLSKIAEEQTRTSTFKGFGTAKYVAPECWKNGKNTIKMDIYSMGIVFFELATLTHPLKVANANNFLEWQDAHLFQHPRKPEEINSGISPIFSQVILKMLEKDTSKRFNDWAEIRNALGKESLPQTKNTALIDNMLKRRIDKDNEIKTEQLKIQKKQTEIKEFKKLVKFQIEKDIIEPLRSFVNEFNAKYIGNKIFIGEDKEGKYSIKLVSNYLLILEIYPLLDEDFVRTRAVDDYGRTINVTRLERPLFKKRKIMAWGRLYNQFGKGFNVILVEKIDEIYGEFFVLWNTNSGINARPRNSEPFAFDLDELEKEINSIGAIHRYNIKVEPLQIEHFVKFLDETI